MRRVGYFKPVSFRGQMGGKPARPHLSRTENLVRSSWCALDVAGFDRRVTAAIAELRRPVTDIAELRRSVADIVELRRPVADTRRSVAILEARRTILTIFVNPLSAGSSSEVDTTAAAV